MEHYDRERVGKKVKGKKSRRPKEEGTSTEGMRTCVI